MAIKNKKVFVAFRQPGSDQSLLFRLWKMTRLDGPLMRPPETEREGLEQGWQDLARYQDQMDRQQAHVDEIKRMCHVPIDE